MAVSTIFVNQKKTKKKTLYIIFYEMVIFVRTRRLKVMSIWSEASAVKA